MAIFQHWKGTLDIEAKDMEVSSKPVDTWLPEAKPEGAELIGSDEWNDEVVFPGLLRVKGKMGPLKVTVSLNATFTGTVEYWKV